MSVAQLSVCPLNRFIHGPATNPRDFWNWSTRSGQLRFTVDRTRMVSFVTGVICSIAFMTKLTSCEPSMQHLQSVDWTLVSEEEKNSIVPLAESAYAGKSRQRGSVMPARFRGCKDKPYLFIVAMTGEPQLIVAIGSRWDSFRPFCFTRRVQCLRRYFVPDTPMVYSAPATRS